MPAIKMKSIKYKGYVAKTEIDVESNLIFGEVIGSRDVITFQGETIGDAVRAFHESVDLYLETCREYGLSRDWGVDKGMAIQTIDTTDRFLGCMLGQAVGDAIGAPYEGLSADHIYFSFGPTGELVKNPSGDRLRYTDDTQMMIGVGETLADCGEIIEDDLCRAFAMNYDPSRGYGTGARKILEAMVAGGDWRHLTQTNFPGGSLGNGAAMRVAPVGLLFARDLNRVAEQAELSARPTHVHPLGIEGAQLMAVAVALASRQEVFDRAAFFEELVKHCRSEEFRWQIETASAMKAHQSPGIFGNSLEAHRSVVTAIACFALSPDSYEGAIATAIRQGNDTDTLAAMAGALSGAYLGVEAIPSKHLKNLENRGKGRHYIEDLAARLHDRYTRMLPSLKESLP